ncbi:MAG TPA: choice-of-anchor Q domain-containing protein, partial [Kofleriaceae bacterium]|nr:choice-of-anchor Q domain-containing protein [Kofleriaceae bacterium]
TGLTLDSSILVNTTVGAPSDTLVGIPACTGVHNSIVFPNAQPVGATNLAVDPQLKNIAAEDYHLVVTSPALDHGDPASTNAVDFDGIARPQGAEPDSGAFEFKP